MRKLLWIGDAAVSTGFARSTHGVLDGLHASGEWEIHVLALNYHGDPHPYPYRLYPAAAGGDAFGLRRTADLVTKIKPDVVVIQNDPWNIPEYLKRTGTAPVVGFLPVDGKNCRGEGLNGLDLAIFWTQFGANEAARGGYRGPSTVIPLGVDLAVYSPGDRAQARARIGLERVKDAFIVGNVNRNQPRKRLDLTVEYFARWIRERGISDAYLYLHVAPTGDAGYDVAQLAAYYGVANRLIVVNPEIGHGVKEATLADTYRCFDVQVSTTQGEGWGLTTMEGMACGVPQVVPDWAALGEWPRGAAALVPCSSRAVTPNYINAVGGIADPDEWIMALNRIYIESPNLESLSARGLALVARQEFLWDSISERFGEALNGVLAGKAAA